MSKATVYLRIATVSAVTPLVLSGCSFQEAIGYGQERDSDLIANTLCSMMEGYSKLSNAAREKIDQFVASSAVQNRDDSTIEGIQAAIDIHGAIPTAAEQGALHVCTSR